MKIYKAEKEISKIIKANTSIAYIASIDEINTEYKSEDIFDKLEDETVDKIVKASIKDNELFYHTSILVTTSWNKNDDVFTPETVWAARNTPVHKPTNLEHDSKNIVGHMTGSWAIDTDGNIIQEQEDITKLPSKFHILVGSVIYKLWDGNDEYQTRVETLLQQIEAGKKFVSMECCFANFDYALSDDKEMKIIARNQDTAFLSKYLRSYGGNGEFNQYKVGRVVRDISFCGKGYVDQPANPESIIFSQDEISDFAQAKICNKTEFLKTSGVVFNTDTIHMEKTIMAAEFYEVQNKELKDKNEVLEKQVAELKEQFAKSNVAKLEKDIDNLKAQTKDLGGDLQSKSEALVAKETEAQELQSKLDELVKSNETLVKANKELADKFSKIEADQKVQARVSMLVDGGFSKEEAETEVANFASLDDKQFEAVAKRIVEATKMMDEKMAEDKKKKNDTAKCSVDETTVDTSKITDQEVESAKASGDQEDETFASVVKNLTAALKTSNQENGDK